jgi:RNA polymerase sporulation-specific sigma factor
MNTVDHSLLHIYCSEIRQYKTLSPEEECQIIQQICRGDIVARETLIQAYLRMVVSIARHPKFCQQEDIMDLIQEGNIGLIQAVDSYLPEADISFAAFATICVRNRIMTFLQKSRELLVLDTPVFEDSDEYVTRADTIADEATCFSDASYRNVEDEWMQEERRSSLLMALESLPWREREVLQLLYGLGVREAMSTQEVAKLLGISTKRVGKIRQKALMRVRQADRIDQRPRRC